MLPQSVPLLGPSPPPPSWVSRPLSVVCLMSSLSGLEAGSASPCVTSLSLPLGSKRHFCVGVLALSRAPRPDSSLVSVRVPSVPLSARSFFCLPLLPEAGIFLVRGLSPTLVCQLALGRGWSCSFGWPFVEMYAPSSLKCHTCSPLSRMDPCEGAGTHSLRASGTPPACSHTLSTSSC